ncbi:hypothetical protein AB0F49_17495 [Micromonospora ureilytica]|uniref:hypothetical protein n=1 Tax=Micromonospora ureilytica TaxID=709868 RepID=UPI0033D46C15
MFRAIAAWLAGQGAANIFAGAATAIAIVALSVSAKANRATRVELVTDVRREWEALRKEWSRCLLLYNGPDYYYVDTSLDERARVRQLIEEVERLRDNILDPEELTRAMSAVSRSVDLLRAEASSVRSVVRFLAYAGELLLNGRLSPTDASSILGPDIAAQGRAIRWMAGITQFYPGSQDDPEAKPSEWANMADQITSWHYHAEQEVLLCLTDILWAEAAKSGNIDPDILLKVALHKTTNGTGRRCRRRVFLVTRRRGGLRLAIAHHRLLRHAEKLPFNSVFGGTRKPAFEVDASLIQAPPGFAWVVRRRVQARCGNETSDWRPPRQGQRQGADQE